MMTPPASLSVVSSNYKHCGEAIWWDWTISAARQHIGAGQFNDGCSRRDNWILTGERSLPPRLRSLGRRLISQ
jgi:hypothetical protein